MTTYQAIDQPDTASRRVFLLGALRIHDARGQQALLGGKPQSLLAYLCLHPRAPQHREALADVLWPEASPERARRNVSDTLYRLHKALGAEWLALEGDTVALQVDDRLWVDVWEFDRLARSQRATELQHAVDLYAGHLLPELYDDWLLAERELRRNQYLSTLERLAALQEAQGELQPALLNARRLILAEPLHEPAHQGYLRLLGRLQRYGEALAHYEYLRQLLRTELKAEPLAETQAFVQTLKREREIATAPVAIEERMAYVGRAGERAAALAAVEAALRGRGSILAIEGEAGMGKSRLVREVAAGARWRGATFLQGTASEAPDASPFSPLADALAPLLKGPRAAQLETLLASEMLAALTPLHPAWGPRAPRQEALADQAESRFYHALRPFGEALARLVPLALALDDLQWADPALWKCLDALARGLIQSGALLLVAYRRPEIEQTAGWEVLQSWERAGLLRTIALEPLSVAEVAELLGDQPNADPEEVHALTGGSPFYIGEWLAEPRLEQPAHRHAAARRLEALSPAARSALESAAVLGENIPFRLWAATADLPPLVLAALSDELAGRHWLQPSADGYAFVHDLVRTAAYDQIEPMRRRTLHERAARTLAHLEPDNARARAFHFDRAELSAEAASAYRQAGEQDLGRFAFGEAQSALQRALALMPPLPTVERIETALALAEVCETTGDRTRQQAALGEALAGAAHLNHEPLRLRGLLAAGHAASRTGRLADAEARLSEALGRAQRLRDRASEIDARLLLGDLAREQAHWNDAQQHFVQALDLARAAADTAREARALLGLGSAASGRRAAQEAIPWLEQAIQVYGAMGNRWKVATTQATLMSALNQTGAWDRSIATADEAIPVLEALGDRMTAAVARHNQALALHTLGEQARARQNLERNVQEFAAVGSRRALGATQEVLGNVAEAQGRDEEALSLYRAALANAEAVKAATVSGYTQRDLGTLLIKLGRPAEAIPHLEAARAIWLEQDNAWQRIGCEAVLGLALLATGQRAQSEALADGGWAAFRGDLQLGEGPQEWLWMLYRLLTALGQTGQAAEVLKSAYEELQRQARAIGDPERRRGFFERVPLHRAIVAAHDEAAGAARVVTVWLARRTAPLGRPLRPDERVWVQWTVTAPDDETISGSSARRRHRLRRLLQEAEAQAAAPTDDDLAQALGVSRRTILRDMQALAQEIAKAPTRKRKS